MMGNCVKYILIIDTVFRFCIISAHLTMKQKRIFPFNIRDRSMILKTYFQPFFIRQLFGTIMKLSLIHILAALRTFYSYYYKKELITTNPTALVDSPKLHEKSIIRLDVDEVAKLLDEVESGENLTAKQQAFHEKTKVRDLALLTLFLGTGIRVSECVGLDINDVDLKNNGIRIIRKGGNEVVVYFSEEVREALIPYLEERSGIAACEGHQNALFLSLQRKRITVRSVEKLVKKYASVITQLKKITPHKLRSTYGTSLYRETGDIYPVSYTHLDVYKRQI